MKLTELIENEYETLTPQHISDIKRNPKKTEEVQELVNAFLYFLDHEERDPIPRYLDYYGHRSLIASDASMRIQHVNFSSEDITHLTVLMAEHSNKKNYSVGGIFLTNLIMSHYKKNKAVPSYTFLFENHTNSLQDLLLEFNGPTVHIFGDVGTEFCHKIESGSVFLHGTAYGDVGEEMYDGSVQIYGNVTGKVGKEMINGSIKIFGNSEDEIGDWMKNGKITVDGNAESLVGKMQEGGEIIIGGNATEAVGGYMKGGKITIKGDTHKDIGHGMQNGSIYLEGKYPLISELIDPSISNGKIYHKGKQIFPQEKMNESYI